MGPVAARLTSVVAGVGAFGLAGGLLGGVWWVAAGAGATTVVASQFDHRMSYPLVLAALAATVGAAGSDHEWLVVAVVAGVIASIEFAAGADRVTVVRPTVPMAGRVAGSVMAAATLATVIVLLGDLTWSRGDWAAIVAALAAVVSVRLLAR